MIEALEVPLLAQFHKEYPEIRLELHHGNSLSLRKALQEERIDIALVSGLGSDQANTETCTMRQSEIVYCVNREHPYAKESTISMAQVSQMALVEIEGSQHFRETILARFHEDHCAPKILWSTSQLYTKIQLIKNGAASGFLYRPVAEREPDLVSISLDPPLYYDIEMLWLKNSTSFENIHTFLEFARKHGVAR